MGYVFRKQTVAVIGATGQVGFPLTRGLLELGHAVRVLCRNINNEKVKELENEGASILHTKMDSMDSLVETLRGSEVLVCAVPATPEILDESEPLWLEAALKAGIKRFVPTEFGGHTRGMNMGEGVLFDKKKKLHEKIFASGIGWTFVYTGGIFDYFLPNLRFFDAVTTFGDLDIPIYTHEIEDIGRFACMAVTDDRTLNKCAQMDFQSLTQRQAVEMLKANFPDYEFKYEHFSTEYIIKAKDTPSDTVSSKKGAETDQERWGINYVIYVLGKMASFTNETMRGTDLYQDFRVLAKAEDALKDPNFVFES